MMMTRQRDRAESGFTLVELMVSLTVLSVAIAAAFALAFSLMNGFRDHRRAVNVESTTRIILDILASSVRAASPGMVSGAVWDPCIGGTAPTINVINSSTAPDQLEVIHALGGALASMTEVRNLSGGTLVVDDNTSFESGTWVPAIVVEPLTSDAHLVEVFAAAGNQTNMAVRSSGNCAATWGGNYPSPPFPVGKTIDDSYPAGSFVVRAIHVTYSVVPPLLMVDPDGPGALPAQVMAEGIEDLQIAVGVENGLDTGTLSETPPTNLDEWHYNDASDLGPPGISDAFAANDLVSGWRALRITVVGVDSRETRQSGVNLRPAVEDRPAATLSDPFRRRVFSTTVQLRSFERSQ